MTGSAKDDYVILKGDGWLLDDNGLRRPMQYYIRRNVARLFLPEDAHHLVKVQMSDFVVDMHTGNLVKCRVPMKDLVDAYIEKINGAPAKMEV